MSYIGTSKVGGMYLGDTKIAKAYLGDDLVYDSAGGGSEPSEPRSVDASNGYVNKSGAYFSVDSFFHTTTVQVNAGQVVSWTGKSGGSCSAIHYYDNDNTFHNAVTGISSSTTHTYSWTATVNCNVGICGSKTDAPTSFDIDGETITINY